MEYRLTYSTSNTYARAVSEMYLDFLILPANEWGRTLVASKVVTSPRARYVPATNKYGYRLLRFSHLTQFGAFALDMECVVRLEPGVLPPNLEAAPGADRQQAILAAAGFMRENYFFLRNTALTDMAGLLPDAFLRAPGESVQDFLLRLTASLYQMIDYTPGVTGTHTTAREAFQMGQGVCQDFAHMFIGCCRAAHIPARYVSGYLYTGEGSPAQLHAWVEALVPGAGWVGIDPANHLLTNQNYIKIAHGTDYSECPSLRGVIRDQVEHATAYKVTISQQNQ